MSEAFDWKRYWFPRSGRFQLDRDGFLQRSSKNDWFFGGRNDAVSFEEIKNKPLLVLLGEPGMGKSTLLKQEYERCRSSLSDSEKAIFHDLRKYSSDTRFIDKVFNSDEMKNWCNGSHILHLFLDSFDECHDLIQNLPAFFPSEVKRFGDALHRLRLRIVCRTARWENEWTKQLADVLKTDGDPEYELAPLTRKEVEDYCKAQAVDPESFLRSVASKRLGPLAARPLTLDFLLEQFKKNKELPESTFEIYRQGCLNLCTENPNRRDSKTTGKLEPEERFEIASQIAAAMIFCGKNAVSKVDDFSHKDSPVLAINKLTGEKFRRRDIEEVLDTGLFSGRESNLLGFTHETFASFLAAGELLKRYGKDTESIMKILVHPESETGKIVPQFAEVAAWIAGRNKDVFTQIAEMDPQVLLKADVRSISDDSKSHWVSSFLTHLEQKSITHKWELVVYYDKLSHGRLAEQLRPYIQDKSKEFFARRTAIDIAEACQAKELQDLLLQIALDTKENRIFRKEAVQSIAEIGDDDKKKALKPLLQIPPDEDPDDEIKGATLLALWPALITAEEVFAILNSPQEPLFWGGYRNFFQQLPNSIPPDDFPIALKWCISQKEEQNGFYSTFDETNGVLAFAWKHVEELDIIEPLSKAILARIRNDEDYIEGEKTGEELDPLSDEPRRSMIRILLQEASDEEAIEFHIYHFTPKLVLPADVPWLISQLKTETDMNSKRRIASLLETILWQNSEIFPLIYQAAQEDSILREETKSYWGSVDLDSEEAERFKKVYENGQESIKRIEACKKRRERNPEKDKEHILLLLQNFEDGNIDSFWDMCRWLCINEGYIDTHHDMTILPLWNTLEEEAKERILNAAEVFLQERNSNPSEWLGKHIFHWPAWAGYRALFLLNRLRPEAIDRIGSEVWKDWTDIIFERLSTEKDEDCISTLIEKAYHSEPDAVMKAFSGFVTHREDGYISSQLDTIQPLWDDRMATHLLALAKKKGLPKETRENLLCALVSNGDSSALAYCRNVIRQLPGKPGVFSSSAIAAGTVLLAKGDHEANTFILKKMLKYSSFGEKVILSFAREKYEKDQINLLKRLEPCEQADMFVWLAKQFPPADTTYQIGAHFMSEEDFAREYRGIIRNRLVATGTKQSLQSFQRAARELKGLADLDRDLIQAERIYLANTAPFFEVDGILTLLRETDSVIVRNGEHLLELVLQVLEELSSDFQKRGRAEDVWNTNPYCPKDEKALSGYIQRYLQDSLQTRKIISCREVETRRGQFTDIYVNAFADGEGSAEPLEVIIEVKGCWHSELATAMETQLVDRYMKNHTDYGIYLVGWYVCSKWNKIDQKRRMKNSKDRIYWEKHLVQEAERLSIHKEKKIKAFFMDATLPD